MKQVVIIVLLAIIAWLLYDRNSRPGADPNPREPSETGWSEFRNAQPKADSASRSPSESGDNRFHDTNIRNKSKWKLDHPETMTDEEMVLAENWVAGDKGKYHAAMAQARGELGQKTQMPYRCNSRFAQQLEETLRELETAIADDDFLAAKEWLVKTHDALIAFRGSCVWQPGMRRGDGWQSSALEGEWELEPGYEIYNGRPARVEICGLCHGNKYTERSERCGQCRGSGKIRNPAASFKGAARGSTRNPWGKALIDAIPEFVQCPDCRGFGSITVSSPCSRCGGRGKIYH